MNKQVVFRILRIILVLFLVIMIYEETGIYTATFALVIGVFLEGLRLMLNDLLKKIHQIKDIIFKDE